ncbi:DUF115 domain-containing protein [Caldibacillus lycopersici]|uniref:DUF115 domain-containing protein n=1 Tax=Perspicuibacillus lycopersici TaxID=1325689 RepID=A0AAE3IRG2_9BACI|nr:6-hydroxymethylpterin diphosphokinase MptE-like protein [Perspicuibacillus lycopersici]MCU9612318.1 DUF115 domain-containing protein [Perspicuibacillus lycopersici]
MIAKIKQSIPPKYVFNIKRFLRVTNIHRNTLFERLKLLKNIHKGDRCFIVATGPSLTISDLEKLKNEITFSMNSIVLAFNETDWRPTYYGIQSLHVYRKLERQIENIDTKGVFIADRLARCIQVPESLKTFIFPLNVLNHNKEGKKYSTKFSDDPFKVVFDGYSITYSLIQIAVYMGFKQIYLLGADSNYASNSNHHFIDYGHGDPNVSIAGEKMISAYKVAKRFADHHNIKIYNATRGGMLEVFERVDLDAVLKK